MPFEPLVAFLARCLKVLPNGFAVRERRTVLHNKINVGAFPFRSSISERYNPRFPGNEKFLLLPKLDVFESTRSDSARALEEQIAVLDSDLESARATDERS